MSCKLDKVMQGIINRVVNKMMYGMIYRQEIAILNFAKLNKALACPTRGLYYYDSTSRELILSSLWKLSLYIHHSSFSLNSSPFIFLSPYLCATVLQFIRRHNITVKLTCQFECHSSSRKGNDVVENILTPISHHLPGWRIADLPPRTQYYLVWVERFPMLMTVTLTFKNSVSLLLEAKCS